MKIILSGAGGGKTAKVAELMAELSHEGKDSLFISGELDIVEFKRYAIRAKADLDKLRYSYATDIDGIVKAVANKDDEKIKKIFIDMGYPVILDGMSKSASTDYILEMLSEIEELHGKDIYITLQAKVDDERLNGEKLIITDYI